MNTAQSNFTASFVDVFSIPRQLNSYTIKENGNTCYARGQAVRIVASSESEAVSMWLSKYEG